MRQPYRLAHFLKDEIMKSDRKILFAFILNAAFSIFELVGGIMTGSVAILSDSIHDFGDALSIGISYILERKSKKPATEVFTYGYARYSTLGGLLTACVLLMGSIVVITNATHRIANPVDINYNGMLIFAVIGVVVNLIAARLTHGGHSLNQRAVSLHMIEDVLGWIVVLIGAIVMRFTDFTHLDSLLSIGVAVYVICSAIKLVKDTMRVLLEQAPQNINVRCVQDHVLALSGVLDVHHMHVWSIDGLHHCATMHVVANVDHASLKQAIKEELQEHGIVHATIEFEHEDDMCPERMCPIEKDIPAHSHHDHHH